MGDTNDGAVRDEKKLSLIHINVVPLSPKRVV